MITCSYCGTKLDLSDGTAFRSVPHGLACRDVAACDAREEQRHRTEVKELRRRRREGDELTEAEKQTLGDAA